MAVYAIGDVQGCDEELGELLQRIRFRPDRDRLWFVGDIVNRGPRSLSALRRVHALRDNAVVVLGNHDLHLLAVAHSRTRHLRDGDTLDALLQARDRDRLLDWLIARPLFHYDADLDLAMVHAGLPPQWDLARTRAAAAEVHRALRSNAVRLFAHMYGNEPDQWDETLSGYDRLRFMVNCFTRLRYCDAKGRINLKLKDAPCRGTRDPGCPGSRCRVARARTYASSVVTGRRSAITTTTTSTRSIPAACGVAAFARFASMSLATLYASAAARTRRPTPTRERSRAGCGDGVSIMSAFLAHPPCSIYATMSAAAISRPDRDAGSMCTNRRPARCMRAHRNRTRAMCSRPWKRRAARFPAGATCRAPSALPGSTGSRI